MNWSLWKSQEYDGVLLSDFHGVLRQLINKLPAGNAIHVKKRNDEILALLKIPCADRMTVRVDQRERRNKLTSVKHNNF